MRCEYQTIGSAVDLVVSEEISDARVSQSCSQIVLHVILSGTPLSPLQSPYVPMVDKAPAFNKNYACGRSKCHRTLNPKP